ncbi:hypothetical protein ABIA32_003386 [Streptacidiphilus sp. MAP12-20]|uniref:hypothetical protein n=1 Tax=Streptacidiphilus sp. MAP12-20 TaxID=3156299 RepID=UPI003518DD8D
MNDDDLPSAPAPLIQLLQLPGLPAPTGGAPACGPDGCAVPQAEEVGAHTNQDR